MNKSQLLGVTKKHYRTRSLMFNRANTLKLNTTRHLEEDFKNKDPKTQFLFSHFSLFSAVPLKQPAEDLKILRLSRQKTRVESLNMLMSQCNEAKVDGKSVTSIRLFNKKAGKNIEKIKRSLKSLGHKSNEVSCVDIREEVQILGDQLSLATQNLKCGKRAWKFCSRNIPKNTERLIVQVDKQLSARKLAKKGFENR